MAGRKSEPGIKFYRMNCGHTGNRKVKLLMHDCGPEAYWVWQCILDETYNVRGYYFNYKDVDYLQLFCDDVCKVSMLQVLEYIEAMIRRDLFNERIANKHGILTSSHIQEHYIEATRERRRKESVVGIVSEYLLIDIKPEERNIEVVSATPADIPTEKPAADGEPRTPAKNDSVLRDQYKAVTGDVQKLQLFVRDHRPEFIEPYVELWNMFATSTGLSIVKTITDTRKKKFKTRIAEKTFAFTMILKKAKESEYILSHKWFTLDWMLESQSNYIKVIEGQYDNGKMKQTNGTVNKEPNNTGDSMADVLKRKIGNHQPVDGEDAAASA